MNLTRARAREIECEALGHGQVTHEINSGLIFSRYLSYSLKNENAQKQSLKPDIEAFLATSASSFVSPTLYKFAFHRWKELITASVSDCAVFSATTKSRLILGNGEPHAAQTNTRLSWPYGVPVIPGSAIKGLLRAYLRHHPWSKQEDLVVQAIGEIFGAKDEKDLPLNSGGVIFHQAWWQPDSKSPFRLEVITPHHQAYYKEPHLHPPLDNEDPVPVPQIAVMGTFLFCIEGDDKVVKFLSSVLQCALSDWGLGGKTSLGYGQFSVEGAAANGLGVQVAGSFEGKLAAMQRNELCAFFARGADAMKERYGEQWPSVKTFMSKRHPLANAIRSWRAQGGDFAKAYQTIHGA
jgi:CRISPR type III-B/RAMP module RAMP protein Cmr6